MASSHRHRRSAERKTDHSNVVLCPSCKAEIEQGAKHCKSCGADFSDKTPASENKPVHNIKSALSQRFEIVENLGKGDACTVYRARDRKSNVEVALEVLPPHLAGQEDYVNRFHNEANALSKLNNRNISKIYEEGVHNGVHFVAVEFLDGLDLHTMIMWKGRLEEKEVMKIIVPTIEALAYAHGKGLIHRDLRSSNIIVTDVGRPVLTDFWVDHSFSGARLAGALEYMSPEQVGGKEPTRISNIYCFGVMLYEALTGKVPFSGSNPFEIVGKIMNTTPISPRKITSAIPDWMEGVVLKCLAKDPDDRYSSAAELAAAMLRSKHPILTVSSQQSTGRYASPRPQGRTKVKVLKPKKNERAKSTRKLFPPARELFRKKSKEKLIEPEVHVPTPKPVDKPVEKKVAKPPVHLPLKPILRIAVPSLVIAAAIVFASSSGLLRRGNQDVGHGTDDGAKSEEALIRGINPLDKSESRSSNPAPSASKQETIASNTGPGTTKSQAEPQRAELSLPNANLSKQPAGEPPKSPGAIPPKADDQSINSTHLGKVMRPIPLVNIQWVFVDSGTFQMGSTNYASTKPTHSVKVSRFYMSATEITFEQYDKFCDVTNAKKPDDNGWGRGKMPVVNVSWNDAVAFCRWMSDQAGKTVRLPTEAEYEYAARGGSKGGGYAFSGSSEPGGVAWYADNSGGKPHVVGSKAPNELGLYDMSGNVWEWCEDWYHQSYDKAPSDGSIWNVEDRYNPYRVLRGGSANGASYCSQVVFRFWLAPFFRDKVIGFRCVEEAK